MAAEETKDDVAMQEETSREEGDKRDEASKDTDEQAKKMEVDVDDDAPEYSREEDDKRGEGKEQDDEAKEEDKEPEEPKEKELEEDAVADSRPRVAEGLASMGVLGRDLTINAMSNGDGILTALSEGGLQHFMAAARANLGVKAGRYFYEVRVLQTRTPFDGASGDRSRFKVARQHVRVGFSTAGSSLFVGDVGGESVGFDSDGMFYGGNASSRVVTKRMPHHEVYGVLLNLDPASPNASTISLFRDGVRTCPPQQIPEGLKGKALYPTVNYKNMVIHVSFGPAQFTPLPFRCLTLQEAAKADTEVIPSKPEAQPEVIVPVGLPDQGTFEWLDGFLAEHPECVELSDRNIIAWAEKSGIQRRDGYNWRRCNDRPGMEFDVRELDDNSVKQLLQVVAPALPRSYVVMEVRNNLLSAGRRAALEAFAGTGFRRVAMVVMGEPPEAFKEKARASILERKRERAVADAQKKQRARHSAREDKDEKEDKDEGDKDKKKDKDEGDKEALEVDVEKIRESIELTDLEKEAWFPSLPAEDLTKKDLAACFTRFSIPTQSEGFDEVRFAWQSEEQSKVHLEKWLLERKLTSRVEDLQPGSWFRDAVAKWENTLQKWRRKQGEWSAAAEKRLARDRSRARKKAARKAEKEKKAAEKLKEEEAKEEKEDEEKKEDKETTAEEKKEDTQDKKEDEKPKDVEEGKEKSTEDVPEKEQKEQGGCTKVDVDEDDDDADAKKDEDDTKAEDTKKMEDGEEDDDHVQKEEDDDEEDGDQMQVDAEEIDAFAVADVCDIGGGEPLFANFGFEDWMLLSLRFELHVLVHAFRQDLNDEQRVTFHESHLEFYYDKYFKRSINLKQYGVESTLDLLKLVEDTVEAEPQKLLLKTHLSDDTPLDNFVKLTEDGRRERKMIIDGGDESAELNFIKAASNYGHTPQQYYNRGGYQGNRGPPLQRNYPTSGGRGPPLPFRGEKGGYSGGKGADVRGGDYRGAKGGGGYKGGNYQSRGYEASYSSGPQKRPYNSGPPQQSYGGGGAPAYKQARTSSYQGSAPSGGAWKQGGRR